MRETQKLLEAGQALPVDGLVDRLGKFHHDEDAFRTLPLLPFTQRHDQARQAA
jgi:hypothetical protein